MIACQADGVGTAAKSEILAALQMDKRVVVISKFKFAQTHDGPSGAAVHFAACWPVFHPSLQRCDSFRIPSVRVIVHRRIPLVVGIGLRRFGATCGRWKPIDLAQLLLPLRPFGCDFCGDCAFQLLLSQRLVIFPG